MNLNKAQVEEALENEGYSDNGIVCVSFLKINDRAQAIYHIIFKNPDTVTGRDTGRVFIWNDNGKLRGEF